MSHLKKMIRYIGLLSKLYQWVNNFHKYGTPGFQDPLSLN